MRRWTEPEKERLASASSLRLAAGAPASDYVELGMVLVDDELYVRAFSGARSHWFAAAVQAGIGAIEVDGHRADVLFQRISGDDDRIEAAYRRRYGVTADLVATNAARAATLLITAR